MASVEHTSRPDHADQDVAADGGPRRNSRRWWALVAVLVLALAVAGWAYWDWSRPSGDGSPAAGRESGPVAEYPPEARGEAVDLSGTTLTDAPLDVADLRGEVVVVNVWGSWCVPCREEAPILSRLSREYADAGVSFVGVNVKDNRAAALAFEDEFDIPYPSIEDRDGRALLGLSGHVPAQAVPVTLVLDREGRVAARVIGAIKEGTLRSLVDGVLEGAPDGSAGPTDG